MQPLGCAEGTEGSAGGGEEQSHASLRAKLDAFAWKSERELLFAIVDIRTPQAFAEGSIQDAINIPYDSVLDEAGELVGNGEALTSILSDLAWDIVIYGDDAGDTVRFVAAAEELGYTNVSHYPGGIEDWIAHHEYLVIAYGPFRQWYDAHCPFDDGENYLIDVNEEEDYTGEQRVGHIPGATLVDNRTFVSMDGSNTLINDAKTLTDALPDKEAKVVIYCSDTWCPISEWAAEVAVSLGYTNVYRLEGGYAEWERQGNDLALGPEPGACAEPIAD